MTLPFAYISVLIIHGSDFDFKLFLLVIAALSCGFMAGCTFNGLSDKDFDKENPRTFNRPIASKRVSPTEAVALIAALGVTVTILTLFISPTLIFLLPFPAGLCVFYSLSKRHTWLCHFLIGTVHAIPPVSVAIVFGKTFTPKVFVITAVAVITTVETDLLYSVQDTEYDVIQNLKSIPVVFGIQTALKVSFMCYLISLCIQVLLCIVLSFDLVPIVIVFLANILLLMNHVFMRFGRKNGKKILTVYQIFILLITTATVIQLC